MTELRWVLSALGVLFVVGLFLWERRKQRPAAPALQSFDARETPEADADRLASGEPPASASWTASRAPDPTLVLPEIRPREPIEPLPVVEFTEDSDADDFDGGPRHGMEIRPPRLESTLPDPAALRLEWPEEPERQIIAARVVPVAERFVGRTVRQALAGEGFVHGPLGIFHRALPDGRVVLSCASLTKPGSFNLASMDSQRYAGLNLFGVLPGPLAGCSALEDLVTVARTLASRLGGLVQDDRGQPFDATRVAELKATLGPLGALASRPPGPAPVSGERAP